MRQNVLTRSQQNKVLKLIKPFLTKKGWVEPSPGSPLWTDAMVAEMCTSICVERALGFVVTEANIKYLRVEEGYDWETRPKVKAPEPAPPAQGVFTEADYVRLAQMLHGSAETTEHRLAEAEARIMASLKQVGDVVNAIAVAMKQGKLV